MAIPLLAPLAFILPVLKVLALGSVKFVGVGIGAAVAPVATANFLVRMSAGTPLKYAKFRHEKGLFNDEQLLTIESATQLVQHSLDNPQQHLSRAEAREFLKEVLTGTLTGMADSVLSIPSQLKRFSTKMFDLLMRPFSSDK